MISGVIFLFYLIFDTKFGARLLEASLFDEGSAGVRLKVWSLLNDFNSYQLLFGINDRTIENTMQTHSIDIIENFWLYWVFQFGLVFLIPLAIMLFYFLKNLLKNFKRFDKIFLIVVFLGVASTNNSLASDTAALLIFTICSYAFLPPKLPPSKYSSSSKTGQIVRAGK
jgi:hypothetical protein